MELIETALAKAGISGIPGLAKFIGKIAGPAVGEFGLMLQDRVRSRRFFDQVKTYIKAQTMLEKAGEDPQVVPSKILFPLLDGAALEEDEDLSTKWAALLANAANPNAPFTTYPSYPHILTLLSKFWFLHTFTRL